MTQTFFMSSLTILSSNIKNIPYSVNIILVDFGFIAIYLSLPPRNQTCFWDFVYLISFGLMMFDQYNFL